MTGRKKKNYGTEVSGKQMNRGVWYNDYYRYSNVKSLSRYGTPFSWEHSSPRLREKFSLLCLFLRFFLCWENFPVRQDLTNSGLFLFITALVIDVRRFTMYITLGAWYDKLRLLHWIKNGMEEKKCESCLACLEHFSSNSSREIMITAFSSHIFPAEILLHGIQSC